MEERIFYTLALALQRNYGATLIKKILDHYGSAKAFFEWTAQRGRRSSVERLPRQKPVITKEIAATVNHEMQLMKQHNISCCLYTDEHYPKRLRHCVDAPAFFFYKGNADAFNTEKVIAMVGTRMATSYGRDAVGRVVGDCAGYEPCIVSGLAHGIDTAAHEVALEHSLPTVAVMGSGFGHIYPAGNRTLAQRIIEHGGAVISEYFYQTMPDKQNFPKRNRIIAGMADATIVVETGIRGGSVITAHIANSYNRDVFAVPGPVNSNSSEGCNELIRKNMAALICNGTHLAEMMGWDHETPKSVQRTLFVELSDSEQQIINLLQEERELHIDDINGQLTQLTASQTASILLQLELKGVIRCKPGKIYTMA